MKQPFDNRRIIWESKRTQIAGIAVSVLAVAAALWTRDKYSPFRFWAAIIFFGGGGLFLLFRLLNPKNRFLAPEAKLREAILTDRFHQAQEDSGLFSYTDDGFSLKEPNGETFYKWSDIETVFGFKEDRYTTDEICMDIFTSDSASLRLTESTPGWYQFQSRLRENITAIANDWERDIAVPAFETKLTLLFDRKGRTPNEAAEACYPE